MFLLTLTAVNYLFYLYKKNQSPDFPVWAIAGFTTFSLIFALAVYEAVMKDNRFINFFLTNPVLRFLGKYSYGFYIFHWPVYVIFYPYVETIVRNNMGLAGFNLQVVVSLIVTIMGFAVSLISYHLYEKYWLKLKVHFT